jgi:uncharacterized membrane protein YphA (DoxX/SURF4 family)
MPVRDKCAVSIAPLFLRLVLGVTFVWAGLGKLAATMPVSGDDLVLLESLGVVDPAAGTTPTPVTPAVPVLPPTDTPTTPAPAGPNTPPPAASQPAATQPAPGSERPAPMGPFTPPSSGPAASALPPTLVAAASAAIGAQGTDPVPPLVRTVEVKRLHGITLLTARAANPPPGDDPSQPRMRLLPQQLGAKPWPVVLAWAACITELAAGLMVIFGLLTRPAAFALAYTMGVAMWLTVIGPAMQSGNTVAGFLPAHDAFDVNAWRTPLWQFALLGASLALLFSGSGTLAFDRAIFGRPLPALRPLPRQHDAD